MLPAERITLVERIYIIYEVRRENLGGEKIVASRRLMGSFTSKATESAKLWPTVKNDWPTWANHMRLRDLLLRSAFFKNNAAPKTVSSTTSPGMVDRLFFFDFKKRFVGQKLHLTPFIWAGMASTFKDFLLAPFIKHFVKMLRLHIRWSLEHTTLKFRGLGGRPAVASKFIFWLGGEIIVRALY